MIDGPDEIRRGARGQWTLRATSGTPDTWAWTIADGDLDIVAGTSTTESRVTIDAGNTFTGGEIRVAFRCGSAMGTASKEIDRRSDIGIPTNVRWSWCFRDRIQLMWDPPITGDVTNYDVEITNPGGAVSLTRYDRTRETITTRAEYRGGDVWKARVRSVDADGVSPWSDYAVDVSTMANPPPVHCTIPGICEAPADLALTNDDGTYSATWKWPNPPVQFERMRYTYRWFGMPNAADDWRVFYASNRGNPRTVGAKYTSLTAYDSARIDVQAVCCDGLVRPDRRRRGQLTCIGDLEMSETVTATVGRQPP